MESFSKAYLKYRYNPYLVKEWIVEHYQSCGMNTIVHVLGKQNSTTTVSVYGQLNYLKVNILIYFLAAIFTIMYQGM